MCDAMDRLTIEAVVHPTEDVEKVSEAIKNLFGEIELKRITRDYGHLLRYEGDYRRPLTAFKSKLEQERIRDSAGALFTRNTEGNRIVFSLNKQAAHGGHISFYSSGESPLGPINVRIDSSDPVETVTWMTAKEKSAHARHRIKKTR